MGTKDKLTPSMRWTLGQLARHARVEFVPPRLTTAKALKRRGLAVSKGGNWFSISDAGRAWWEANSKT